MNHIFLSFVTFRYRFVELYYRRGESVRKGRTIPARTQTVVIFLPDVRSCLPTRAEWDELGVKYKNHLDLKMQKNIDGDEAVGGTSDGGNSNKKTTKSTDFNDGGNNADIEMVDESKKLEQESHSVGDDECLDSKVSDSNETKTATETNESTATSAISKALLNNIISYITRDSFFPFKFYFSA